MTGKKEKLHAWLVTILTVINQDLKSFDIISLQDM